MKKFVYRMATIAVLGGFTSFHLQATEEISHRVIGTDDLLALKSVSGPQVSPDGQWVAYVVDSVDVEADDSSSQIYMVSVDGNEVIQLTADSYSAGSPKWSPDNRFLGFIAAKGEDAEVKSQVWILDRRGGDSRQYTHVDQGVKDFSWSPDGQKMLLLIRDKTVSELAAENTEGEPKPLPYVIDRLQFKRDGVPYLDRSRTHLYLWNGQDKPPIQLTFGDFDDSQPAWSPDSREIAFTSNRTDEPDSNSNSDIWVVSAEHSHSSPELRKITSNEGYDGSPAWSHDGKYIAYVTIIEPDLIWYATNHLAIASANGGAERVLTEALDRNVRTPVFASDDQSIIFSLEDSAERHIARFNLDTGVIERVVDGNVSIWSFVQHASGELVFEMSMPHLPTELFYFDGSTVRQLTRTNEELLNTLNLADVKNVTFKSSDGTEIEGFIFLPPGYRVGQKYPTILRIHGGPVSQYDFYFNADAQLLAANGFVVVMSNPRGSSGYGQAFSAALFARWGVPDFEDVMAAVDYAIAEGYSDADRLGVGGWSYGGILTNYVITKTDRFEGAITGASEVNFIANYGHDHYQLEWEKELGLPWESKETWEKISPWENVGKVVTPTLVMGGKEDWNVPIQNSEQLYQALKRRGVATQLIVYPDEAHGISRPSFRKDRWQRSLDWYNQYVVGQ